MDLVLALEHVPPLSTLLLQLVTFALLVGLSAFSSGSEVALVGFSRLRRRQLMEEGNPRIAAVEKLMGNTERFLITILIINTLVNAAAAALVTDFMSKVFGSLGVALATGTVTFFLLTFGEITPKAYAAHHMEQWALRVAPILLFAQKVLFPFVVVFEAFTNFVFGTRNRPAGRQALFRSEEEIKTLITLGTEEGILEEKEEDMLHSVIEFSETTAREIMVPRIDMVTVPSDATLEHIRAFVLESGYSRIPVYERSVDNIVGLLYVKDLLLAIVDGRGDSQVRELMRDAYFVPESKKLDDLLAEMREKRMHMSVVIDEHGGTAGIVTLEDVIEEVVGEIFDEYDLRQDPVRRVDSRTFVVDARAHVDDISDAVDIEIPEDDDYDTVAGYIYHELGRLGKEGEVVHGPGFDMVVEKVSNRRILRTRIVVHPEPTGGEEGAAAAP